MPLQKIGHKVEVFPYGKKKNKTEKCVTVKHRMKTPKPEGRHYRFLWAVSRLCELLSQPLKTLNQPLLAIKFYLVMHIFFREIKHFFPI